ncbi:MAG: transposase [Acidimicrobiales bacterium]
MDGSLHKSPAGGEGTGKNPTDRAKIGWKLSVLTDRNGIPIGWATDGANRHDSVLFEPTLHAADDLGLLAEIETLWLDRGYDSDVTRTRMSALGIDDAVTARRRKRGEAPGKRHHTRQATALWPPVT